MKYEEEQLDSIVSIVLSQLEEKELPVNFHSELLSRIAEEQRKVIQMESCPKKKQPWRSWVVIAAALLIFSVVSSDFRPMEKDVAPVQVAAAPFSMEQGPAPQNDVATRSAMPEEAITKEKVMDEQLAKGVDTYIFWTLGIPATLFFILVIVKGIKKLSNKKKSSEK